MTSRGPRWWLVGLAGSYLAYFALLFHCDIRRIEPPGFLAEFRPRGLYVREVAAGSPADQAGLQAGDRVVAALGRTIRTHGDWAIVERNLELWAPIPLVAERGAASLTFQITLGPDSGRYWRTWGGISLLTVRLTQLATLAIALLVVFKRPDDPLARLGAWLLASASVFSIGFPYRMASVWRNLPWAVDLFLWVPFASSLCIGAILFTFFAAFPRPLVATRWIWPVVWVPMAVVAAPFIWSFTGVVYAPVTVTSHPDAGLLMGASAVYVGAGLAVLAVNYGRLEDVNERRRVRVIIPGSVLGLLCGILILASYWRRSPAALNESLFASPTLTAGTLGMLALPVSLAYAILRRRLFDLSGLLRQGVRYALARRLILSMVPVLVAILLADLAWQRDRSLLDVVSARRTIYVALIALVFYAHSRRERWLAALDRQFFRDRYDGQQLLRRVTADV